MSHELAICLVDELVDVLRPAKDGDEARGATKYLLEASAFDLEGATQTFSIALGRMRRAHVGEEHGDTPLLGLANAERKEIEPAPHRLGSILEANRLAGAGHPRVRFEPVCLERRYQLPRRMPHGIREAGLLHERRIGLEVEPILRPVLRIEEYLDDAEAYVDRVEQCAVLCLARAQPLLRLHSAGHITPENGDASVVSGVRVDIEVDVVALTYVVMAEVSLGSLRHHTPVLPLGFGADRGRESVPMCETHERIARFAEGALRRRIHGENAELGVHGEVLVGDLIEHARGLMVGPHGLVDGVLALGDDAMCRFLADHERATDASIVVANRAIAVRPPDVLEPTVALDGQVLVLVKGGIAARHHLFDLRADHFPDIGPELATSRTKRRRVPALGPETRAVRVIVELDQARPPPEEHWLSRVEHNTRGGPQTLRPGRHRAQWRAFPREGTAQGAHLTRSREEHVRVCGGGVAHLEAGGGGKECGGRSLTRASPFTRECGTASTSVLDVKVAACSPVGELSQDAHCYRMHSRGCRRAGLRLSCDGSRSNNGVHLDGIRRRVIPLVVVEGEVHPACLADARPFRGSESTGRGFPTLRAAASSESMDVRRAGTWCGLHPAARSPARSIQSFAITRKVQEVDLALEAFP